MTGRWTRTVSLAALVLVSGCKTKQPESAVRPTAAVSGYREVPTGLCEDHPPESTTEQRMREDFQALQRAGVRLLRVSFGWDDLEPEKDRYDFAPVEMALRMAEEHGVKLIPYVCYTPSWLAAEGTKDNEIYRSPPMDLREFEQLMELLASRYRGRFSTWELWNEPDNREYWLGSAAQYAALVEAGSRGVRRGDPKARVVLGGIAGHLEFLEELLTDHKIAPHIDVVNLHSYSETWNAEPLESIPTYLDRAAALVREHGEGEPLWLAEVGYSSFRRESYVSDWYTARFPFEHTPQFQASALLRILTMARTVPAVELMTWYELRDLPPGTEVIGDHNNRHLGVLDAQGGEKPAFQALSQAVSMLSGRLRTLAVSVRSNAPVGGVEARAFQRDDGRCFVVAWQATHQLNASAEPVQVVLSVGAHTSQRSAALKDSMGNTLGELALERGAPIVTSALTLRPEQTVVAEIAGCQ